MKNRKFLLLLFVIFVGLNMTSCKNVEQIRKKLLDKTPVGMTFDQVLLYCINNKLKCYSSKTAGYLNQETGLVVGSQSIWAQINERKESLFTIASIVAYWGFDENGKLLDIWVWKTIDAP